MSTDKKLKGYRENWSLDDGSSSISYTCPWSSRDNEVSDLLGSEHPDYSNLICTGVDVQPTGEMNSSTGGPDKAWLIASYETRKQAAKPSDNYSAWTEEWQAAGEAITIGEGFVWSDADAVSSCTAVAADESAIKLFPVATITVSGRTFTVDKEAILNCQGKLNKKDLVLKGYTYLAEHLLLERADLVEGENSTGSNVYSLRYVFQYRHENTWNEFWYKDKDGGPGFLRMVSSDGAEPPFSDANFSDIDPVNW